METEMQVYSCYLPTDSLCPPGWPREHSSHHWSEKYSGKGSVVTTTSMAEMTGNYVVLVTGSLWSLRMMGSQRDRNQEESPNHQWEDIYDRYNGKMRSFDPHKSVAVTNLPWYS